MIIYCLVNILRNENDLQCMSSGIGNGRWSNVRTVGCASKLIRIFFSENI